jgi:hypothetical protein
MNDPGGVGLDSGDTVLQHGDGASARFTDRQGDFCQGGPNDSCHLSVFFSNEGNVLGDT